MNTVNRTALSIFLTGLWVNASEFLRNEILLKTLWFTHYQSLGLSFPSEPINGMLWVLWGFLFAAVLVWLAGKLVWIQAAIVAWCIAFPLMWIVLWNLRVLPLGLLVFAIPLSLFEVFGAVWIAQRVQNQ